MNTYGNPDVPSRVEDTHIVLSARIIVPGDENKLLFAFIPTEWTTRDWQPQRGPVTGVLQEIVMADNEDAFFWLIVNYRGTFTVGHETSVCWKYDKAERLFLIYGGDEYNYER